VRLDFDVTCVDIVGLWDLRRTNAETTAIFPAGLNLLLGGTIELDNGDGRYYLVSASSRLAMPLVAEGLRKIAGLVRLGEGGWFVPGATLFWDEPEASLNPKLMQAVVEQILTLARYGIQVFLATHSYVILKELDLQATESDNVRYFGFERGEDGTTANATDDFTALNPNPILDQYDSLYDRELTRSTGRNRRGERVR
jgi:hypothetical protein